MGVCSYLLISFWFSRIQATKSALQAIIINRIGDWALMIALFAYFCLSGSLEFSTLNSLAPYFEPALITVLALGFLVGGFAKSAQLGLQEGPLGFMGIAL